MRSYTIHALNWMNCFINTLIVGLLTIINKTVMLSNFHLIQLLNVRVYVREAVMRVSYSTAYPGSCCVGGVGLVTLVVGSTDKVLPHVPPMGNKNKLSNTANENTGNDLFLKHILLSFAMLTNVDGRLKCDLVTFMLQTVCVNSVLMVTTKTINKSNGSP